MTLLLRPSLFGCFVGRSLLSGGLEFQYSRPAQPLVSLFPFLPHSCLSLINSAHSFPVLTQPSPWPRTWGAPLAPSSSLMLYPQILAASPAWDSELCLPNWAGPLCSAWTPLPACGRETVPRQRAAVNVGSPPMFPFSRRPQSYAACCLVPERNWLINFCPIW